MKPKFSYRFNLSVSDKNLQGGVRRCKSEEGGKAAGRWPCLDGRGVGKGTLGRSHFITLFCKCCPLTNKVVLFFCLHSQSKNANLKSQDSLDSAPRNRRDAICHLNRKHSDKTQKEKSNWASSTVFLSQYFSWDMTQPSKEIWALKGPWDTLFICFMLNGFSCVRLFETLWTSSLLSLGKNIGVCSHFLLQGVFLTQESS